MYKVHFIIFSLLFIACVPDRAQQHSSDEQAGTPPTATAVAPENGADGRRGVRR